VTYQQHEDGVEIVYLEARAKHIGVGTRLVEEVAETSGTAQLWVVTTNDNLDALRFYQRRGFRLAQLRTGAVDASRETLKPEIPLVGTHEIPLRDELELEMTL
jgi:hypothetical protein